MLSEQNRLSFRLMWLWKCVKGRKNSVPPKQPWKPWLRLLVMCSVCEEESCEGKNLLFCPQGSSAFANSRFYGWGLYWAEQSGKCIFTPASIKRVPVVQKYIKKTTQKTQPETFSNGRKKKIWCNFGLGLFLRALFAAYATVAQSQPSRIERFARQGWFGAC